MYRKSSLIKRLLSIWLILSVSAAISYAAGSGTVSKTTHRKSSTAGARSKTTQSRVSKTSPSRTSVSKKGRSRGRKSARVRGQQSIDNARAREIQEALIRAKYMNGEPSGVWDQETKAALIRLQTDNGWQNKVVPDSRALIKLGLGPNHANVINPETSGLVPPANTLSPASAAASSAAPVKGSSSTPQLQTGGTTVN